MVSAVNKVCVDVIRDRGMLADGPEVFGAAHEAVVDYHLSGFLLVRFDAVESDAKAGVSNEMVHRQLADYSNDQISKMKG